MPISIIPNNVSFDIINIYNNKTEQPLENIPYPFNSLTFVKKEGRFLTRIHSCTDDEWNKKWVIDYYFSEFNKVILKYPHVQIQEDESELYSEGRLKLEILDKNSTTIEEAFNTALPTINTLIR